MVNAGVSEVLIVGGGPAGLATALALRQLGASVAVVDARKPPIDKACGEGLMPDSLQDLARLGVELKPEDGAEFRGIRFVNHTSEHELNQWPNSIATAEFPSGVGIGLRRQALHCHMVSAAEDAGVTLLWGQPVQLRDSGEAVSGGQTLRYRWLIGADGLASSVRKWAGLDRGSVSSTRYGFRRHFKVAPWSPYVEVHWGRSGQAYVTPTGPNEVCVAAVVRDPHCRLDALMDEIPSLRARLGDPSDSAPGLDSERGAVTLTRRLSRVARGNVALVGDASGSTDAITGEGMGLAFRQALLLAECLEANDLESYNRLHPGILRLPQTMGRVMLVMDRFVGFRRRAIEMLAAKPAIFQRMLGVHVGNEPLPHFLAAKGFEMAWRLAVPQTPAPEPQS